MALDGVQSRKDHRPQFLEPRIRLGGRTRRLGHGVSDLGVLDPLDARDNEPDLAGAELVDDERLRQEHAHLLDGILLCRRHQAYFHARPDGAVDHPDDDHDPAVRVVPRVEDQRLQRLVGSAFRHRQARHDGLEDLLGADALLGARQNRVIGRKPDDVLDLAAGLLGLCAGQIDLVDDGDHLEPAVHREVRVRQRLCLHALRGIDEQERPLAGRQRPGDLVGEVHMARRVDQVQDVLLAVLRGVMQAHRVRLDRDAALALEIHRVEHLRFHLAGLQGAGELEEAIGERGLAVIDVGDDGEIPDEALIQDAFIMPAI